MAARRERRISQRQLGEHVGVVQQQIARWEANRYRTATLDRVDAVARVLGYDMETIEVDASLCAAEARAVYRAPADSTIRVTPVRDLGEIANRVRSRADVFRDHFGVSRVGIFGSFARGLQSDSSDVDVLVDMLDPGGLLFIEAAEFMEDLLGRRVDFLRPEGLSDQLRERVIESVVYVWAA